MGSSQSPPCHILIVDDDWAIADMLMQLFEEEGYSVAIAENGEAGLHYLRNNPLPQLILLDLNMPIMTGWEFRHIQRRDPRLTHLPVVVISADRSLTQQPFTIDAVDYFRKPFDLPRLVDLTARYCGA